MYVAQEIPQIDEEIAQKGHFRMETIYSGYHNNIPICAILFGYGFFMISRRFV
jgi:hypothetical protein